MRLSQIPSCIYLANDSMRCLPLCLLSSYSILTHDNLSPLLAVVIEPKIHLISMHFPLGSLYRVLHDLDSGE